MESNVGRQIPVSELVSVPVPRERQPTPVATPSRPADVSRVEPSSSMVLRSHTREGRSSVEKPEMQARPEVARQPEVEILAAITVLTHVTVCFGSARPSSVSEEMPVDKPETVPTFIFPVLPKHLPETQKTRNHLGYTSPALDDGRTDIQKNHINIVVSTRLVAR